MARAGINNITNTIEARRILAAGYAWIPLETVETLAAAPKIGGGDRNSAATSSHKESIARAHSGAITR
jgi:hypothetical protein